MSLDLIANWHRYELSKSRRGQRPLRLLAGFPLYGDKYAAWFLRFGLPSIIAKENRRALADAGGLFVLYVDDVAGRMLADAAMLTGVIELRALPPHLVALAQQTPQLKYPLMTAVHSLLIHESGERNAGFSMAVGDLVYSEHYLERLLRLGTQHDVVVHLGLSVDAQRLGDLRIWRGHQSRLEVPAQWLGHLGYKHMQSSWRSWSMHDIGAYNSLPSSHLIHWRARDHIRVHCPHMGPVWLGPERCRAAGVIPVINGGIDAEQHLFGGGFYMPQLADDMMLITLNDEMPAQGRLDLSAFRQHLYGTLGPNFAQLPCFKTACYMPAAPSDEPWLPDEEIEARWRDFCAVLGV